MGEFPSQPDVKSEIYRQLVLHFGPLGKMLDDEEQIHNFARDNRYPEWQNVYNMRTADEKNQFSSLVDITARAHFDRSRSGLSVGEARAFDLKTLSKPQNMGPNRAALLKAIFGDNTQ